VVNEEGLGVEVDDEAEVEVEGEGIHRELQAAVVTTTQATAVLFAAFLTTAGRLSVTLTFAGIPANPAPFTVVVTKPIVTGVIPSAGYTTGGTEVIITGSGFGGDPSQTAVTFNGVAATNVIVLSDTRILATAPASTVTGPVDVRVQVQTMVSDVGAADKFTYVSAVGGKY
jgi:hypothetical protein